MKEVVEALGWVNRIKWLARAAACIAVPGIGCIMGLIGTHLLEKIASEIAERCWFRRDVMFPILRSIKFITGLPGKLLGFILEFLIGLLPGKAKELIGDVNTKEADPKKSDACEDLPDEGPAPAPEYIKSDWKPTPVDHAVVRLYEKYGDAPGNPIGAVGVLMHKSGLSSMPPTVPGVERVEKFLDRVNGDAGAIWNYIRKIFQMGYQAKRPKPTLEEVLSLAESEIAGGVTGTKGNIVDIPEEKQVHDPRGSEHTGGIKIFEF